MNELFEIKGIPLDPDNVAAAVDKFAAAIIASVGEDSGCYGKTLFDAFISYRVAADKDIAEKVYDKLSMKGLFPFLDKYKLLDGQPWKAGFLQGLKGSRCFISLISRNALESCRDHTRNHEHDNVLLEIETAALRYKSETGNNAFIIPVMIGEIIKIDGADALRKFADYAGRLYADTVEGNGQASVPVASIEMKQEIAEMKAKADNEQIQLAPAKATVRIAGATGPAVFVNDVYKPKEEMRDNATVYVKVDNDNRWWLEYNAVGMQLQVKGTADKGKNSAQAVCAVLAKCLPEEYPVGQWAVDVGGKDITQQVVTISVVEAMITSSTLSLLENDVNRCDIIPVYVTRDPP